MQIETFKYDSKTDHYYWNDEAYFVKPYWLAPQLAVEDQDDPELITIVAGGRSDDIAFRIPDEGGFEGMYLQDGLLNITNTFQFLVNIYDEERERPITIHPCHVDTIFASTNYLTTGGGVGILPESIWLDHGETLTMTFYDIVTGIGGTIAPVIHGKRFFADRIKSPSIKKYLVERKKRATHILPCFAPLDENPIVIAANTDREVYFTNPNYFMFEITKILFGPNLAVLGGSPSQHILYQIIDETRQHVTQPNRWIHSLAGMGNAWEPFLTYGPLVVRAKGRLVFRFRNLSQSETTFYVTLAGRQFFV